ncbi:MAG: glycosyltransferase [Anaerolineales bacterium]|nr:glycosyltransferase [Anaerolineales bacterium]
MSTLSVNIVSWNRCEELRLVLNDLQAQSEPADEIVVVDNGSADATVAMVAGNFPAVRVIRLHRNMGLSFGRNVATTAAQADLILFLDSDMRLPDPNFLKKVRASAQRHADCGVITFHPVQGIWSEAARDPATEALTLGEMHALAAAERVPWAAQPYYDWLFWGCCYLVRSEVFDQIGYLDDAFQYGGEEWDFAYRCHAADIRLLRDTSAWLVHTTSPKMRSPVATLLLLKGMIIAQARYMPWPDLLLFLGMQLPKSALDALRQGVLGRFLAICAHSVIEWPRQVARQRRPVTRATMQRFYFLRLNRSDDYAEVTAATTSAFQFYRRRLRKDTLDFPQLPVVAAMYRENT